jgi:hypothetical protein
MRTGDLLVEEVFSSLSVAYHRTRNLKNANAIGESGFKAGGGAMYGKGIYLTYNFDDQQDDYMKEHYGPFIIRCKINLTDFMIFDPDVAARVYGPKASFDEQLKHFGIPHEAMQSVFYFQSGSQYTSARAKQFANWLFSGGTKTVRDDVRFKRPIKGLVFTGENDGRVIVAYDPSPVIPFAWARVVNNEKTRETVKWNKIATPPMTTPTEVMPEYQRAYRFFREQGFTLVSRGPAGATLIGIRDGGYITITITHSLVKSFLTRHDPLVAAKKYPGYYEKLGERLFYEDFGDKPLPLRQIADTIFGEVDALKQRPEQHVQFTEALLHRLLKPGFHVQRQDVTGPDYRRDKTHLTAGSIKVELDMPYYAHTSGKLWVDTKPVAIELGFNDGTMRHGGKPDPEEAYAVLLQMVMFAHPMQAQIWPDDLQPQFVADLKNALAHHR